MPNIMRNMNVISRCQAVYREELLNDGIIPSHQHIIFFICKNPGHSQEDLANDLLLNKSTITRAINKFEEKGYIKRELNKEDKREILVYPTDKLIAELPKLKEMMKEWNEILLKDISNEDIEAFQRIACTMEENARKAVQKVLKEGK